MKTTSKWGWPQNEDDLKNEDDLENEDELKNQDDLKNEDDIKNENDLKNEDYLKNWPSPPIFLAPLPSPKKKTWFFFDDLSPWQPHHNWC